MTAGICHHLICQTFMMMAVITAQEITSTNEEEDAASSVMEATAVATWPKGDPGARIQARARELEDEISSFCVDSANRITVSARNCIMSRVFEMVMVAERPPVGDILEGLAVATAGRPAAVPAGPGVQGVTGTATMGHPVSGIAGGVSYAAALGSRATSTVQGPSRNGPSGPQGAGAPGAVLRQDYVAFLTLDGSTENPARDVVRILKLNIDRVAMSIKDVTLRHTRYGVTVFSHIKQSLINMKKVIEENTVARTAIKEDTYVPMRTHCASYGHGRSSCLLSNDAARATCMRCATEGHTGSQCTVGERDVAVKCAACQRARLSAADHPAGHPQCLLLKEKVARLRARTNYGGA
ncbi:hypothetical protein HPB51_005010 [Rhipicephalus microplus]|uniref:CCHC-type domain-containing protein n=1 Tax=Rhipicephalus microplus TaxID=6941 RepID=A0A9J6E053_RHIMP|nr:hypothetical protein HPB51_005010 [Rhipicephalus microplus]